LISIRKSYLEIVNRPVRGMAELQQELADGGNEMIFLL
jgi:hypothetical protein